MENTNIPLLTVSDFIALTNQTLEYAYPSASIEGEVSSFKVNQGKYVFFDLKDTTGSVGCFMTVWQLRQPIEDGMKVIISASPKLTDWGKFSLTVRTIRPSGEGSLKRSSELLKAKLDKEGLFNVERKRLLPEIPERIGVISSTQAAGYADFIKILNDRWGGLQIDVAHVQVQGADAPNQIIRALKYLNERDALPDVIAIIRGGGSADDLSAFNDEILVREIAASRVPTIVGVGHEVDVSLADLVADVRAATPSNAAQLLVPDRRETIRHLRYKIGSAGDRLLEKITKYQEGLGMRMSRAGELINRRYDSFAGQLDHKKRLLAELDPNKVLARGYAIIRGQILPGNSIQIETGNNIATAEVKHVSKKA